MSTADSPEREVTYLAEPARIRIIAAPYYRQVVEGMRAGAVDLLTQANAVVVENIEIAGAYELPAALAIALESAPEVDGHLILGCVVKGETDHYDHICRAATDGCSSVAIRYGAAIGFGLLTVHSLEQAQERAAPGRFNKGREAAFALLGQVALRRHWGL